MAGIGLRGSLGASRLGSPGPRRWVRTIAFAGVVAFAGLASAAGCASTEFFNEGPGQPSDRASGSVPAGALGVCKRPFSKKPPIVNATLWEHAPMCNAKTPERFVRLGYPQKLPGSDVPADQEMDKILGALREAPKEDGGNARFVSMIRSIRDQAIKDQEMRFRVAKETARTGVCDYSYMLDTMGKEHDRLFSNDPCAAYAYDPKAKQEACLFDTSSKEAVWLTSAWDCVTFTNAQGEEMSCHRLCAYDDYCARQVSCAAPDIDLLLCTMGICLPEPRAGF